jgi:hypothetical protein
MYLSVHIILSEDASSLLQATYPYSHLNCSALGPSFEHFFILGGPRGTRQKNFKNKTQSTRLEIRNIDYSVLDSIKR